VKCDLSLLYGVAEFISYYRGKMIDFTVKARYRHAYIA
jgi:hypothetical protein